MRVGPRTLSPVRQKSTLKGLPAPPVVVAISVTEPMMKSLIFERGLLIGGERVVLSLFRAPPGFVLERRLIERDQTTFVQVLPITVPYDVQRFAVADNYSKELAPLYHEVRRQLLESRTLG